MLCSRARCFILFCPELSGLRVRVFLINEGGISLAGDPDRSVRSKNIDVRYHEVRANLRANKIDIEFVASEEHHADMLDEISGRHLF